MLKKMHNRISYLKCSRRLEERYGCSDCSDCEHKEKCLYKYDEKRDREKNKVMKINEVWPPDSFDLDGGTLWGHHREREFQAI